MLFSSIITLATTLGAVAGFELGVSREDRLALTEACEVLDSFDPSSIEERSIEKRCSFDGCDDCSNNVCGSGTYDCGVTDDLAVCVVCSVLEW